MQIYGSRVTRRFISHSDVWRSRIYLFIYFMRTYTEYYYTRGYICTPKTRDNAETALTVILTTVSYNSANLKLILFIGPFYAKQMLPWISQSCVSYRKIDGAPLYPQSDCYTRYPSTVAAIEGCTGARTSVRGEGGCSAESLILISNFNGDKLFQPVRGRFRWVETTIV